MSHWKISRAGVLNFWYYDEEYFQFEDGRLMLRGANGSGKSVTMQSLVPLLFDGNKSPERLDPFGSKARRMESYLLSDGLDLDERTGYLFLEFEKAEMGGYMTIGMGMRARKNMALQSWYFIVLDGRRIGPDHDLQLYRDMGSKVPLTGRELENRIGSGGRYFTSQAEYKAAVNEHLFGFKDVGEFDELIKLLIQLRSPKLSKEFKPTTMYDIMQNSLQTLTDEDLRPMSESIENMDNIKTKLEQLEISRQAMDRIGAAYDKYNIYQLASKAQHFQKQQEQLAAVVREIANQSNQFEATKLALDQSQHQLESLEQEEEGLKSKSASLKAHDYSRLMEEKLRLEGQLGQDGSRLLEKQQALERQKVLERQTDAKLKEKEAERLELQREMGRVMEVLDEEAEAAAFDEQAFFRTEFQQSYEKGVDFSYVESRLKQHKDVLQKGNQLLGEQSLLEHAYESALAALSELRNGKDRQERKLTETERLLSELKDEYVEKLFFWHGDSASSLVSRSVVSQSAERAQAYGNPFFYEDILSPVRLSVNASLEEIRKDLNLKTLEVERFSQALAQSEAEYATLKSAKELEPPREEKVVKNRRRLEAMGIPHIPLFLAIDFNENASEVLRGHLEEALLDLGLLDALVVAPEHQAAVLSMDPGLSDKYVFSEPQLFSYNVGQYLSVEKSQSSLAAEVIDDVLKSLFLDAGTDAGKAFITEQGHYGMGILRGKTSGDYKPQYIGRESRKRKRQALMEACLEEMHELRTSIEAAQKICLGLENKIKAGYLALEAFPKTVDLEEAFRDVGIERLELKRLEALLIEKGAETDQHYEALKFKRVEVQAVVSRLTLPHRKNAYEEALEAIDQYAQQLNQLKLTVNNDQNLMRLKSALMEQYEEILLQIENLSSDVALLKRATAAMEGRLAQIMAQFEMSDFKAVQMALEETLQRLGVIPSEQKETMKRIAEAQAELGRIQRRKDELEVRRYESELLKNLYENALKAEAGLRYVMPLGDPDDSSGGSGISGNSNADSDLVPVGTNRDNVALDKAQHDFEGEPLKNYASKVLKAYGSILEDRKLIQSLRDDLQERLLKESGQLTEYNLKRIERFEALQDWVRQQDVADPSLEEAVMARAIELQRIDIIGRFAGKDEKLKNLQVLLTQMIKENQVLLDEQDRELFEEILIKSVSRKISALIWHSEKWVDKINDLMESMNTSSGLKFHLKWEMRRAEREDQLGTEELVRLLKMEQGLLTYENRERMIRHFRSKIQESRTRAAEMTELSSFLGLMKEILDYRKWFEFKLFYTKKGEKRKEMTNNAFFTFSGGEKAMAMYVPLFSSVNAKYQAGKSDCPRIVSLDEAFAGVDERNIRDMFRLLIDLDLCFIANSQVLYGDYETVPSLGIYELIRPENVTFVTTLRYRWNGVLRTLVDPAGQEIQQ